MARKPKRGSKRRRRQAKQKTPALPILPPPASLDAARLRQLYSTMLGCRMIVEQARQMASQGLLPGDISASSGREAPEVGVLINLGQEDCVASGRREYMARFIQGTPLRQIFVGLCTVQVDGHHALPASSRALDMFLPSASFNSQLGLAMGAAWAFKLQRKPQVAVSIADDHSHWQSISDAVNFSAAYQLPIVHVIAAPEPNDGETRRAETVISPHLLPCFVVDGNDVVAVYRVAQEAIRRARQGHGPAFIECRISTATSRPLPVPAAGNVFEDPLQKMEAQLRSKSLWSEKWKSRLVKRFARDLDRAVEFARRNSQPGPSTDASPSSAGEVKLGHPAAPDGAKACENAVVRDTGRLAGSRG